MTTDQIDFDPNETDKRETKKNKKMPWEQFDPNEKFIPKNKAQNIEQVGSAINVKFNRYEHELLKYIAQKENRSVHGQIKQLIANALEDAVSGSSLS